MYCDNSCSIPIFYLADLQASFDELRKQTGESEKRIEEFEVEKIEAQKEIESGGERIKRLENEASEREKEQGEDARMREEMLSRVEELERGIEQKDNEKALIEAEAENVEKLRSEHKKTADLLKQQVKDAAKEVARIRETSEGQTREYREEIKALRERLSQIEAEKEAARTEKAPEVTPATQEISGKARKQKPEAVVEPESSVELETPAEPELAEASSGGDVDDAAVADIRARSAAIAWEGNFENFEVSEPNVFSISMAEKIARNPGELYNPLCIYGPEGSGKTHILHSIGDLSTSEDPDLICALVSVESILNVVQGEEAAVAAWLESVRLLIIDDFSLADVPPDLQQKLYEFLLALTERDAQIAIASEEPPIRMNYLQEYFLRFLEGGLLARLDMHPDILEERKEAVEAIVEVAIALTISPEPETEEPSAGDDSGEPEPEPEPQRDFLDEFLSPDPSFTESNFRGKRVFDDIEEAFRYPNKKWKNRFPLLVIDGDDERRNHFFHALANKLSDIFDAPVALLSINKLTEMLALTPSFDWNGLLNKLTPSAVVLIDDCQSVGRVQGSGAGYLRAIVENIVKQDTLLMVGMSKQYKKEPIFGTIVKKASRKKI